MTTTHRKLGESIDQNRRLRMSKKSAYSNDDVGRRWRSNTQRWIDEGATIDDSCRFLPPHQKIVSECWTGEKLSAPETSLVFPLVSAGLNFCFSFGFVVVEVCSTQVCRSRRWWVVVGRDTSAKIAGRCIQIVRLAAFDICLIGCC